MILLKANLELKTVFQKMINTMGENVKWTNVFIINNNDIILAGKGRSLFFNFDNKRSSSILVELPLEADKAEQITQNVLLENTLNMILYAFGKWGGIKGLKVEKDYEQLNSLINNILAEIDIESALTRDNFRFYKNGVQITYEEVIQAILDKTKPVYEEDSVEETKENDENEEESEKKYTEYEMGLWHNMCWTAGKFSFVNEEFTENDKAKSRLGHDFYIVKYKCPVCGEKLYMAVYPIGREFRVETDVEAVYMARAYTCNSCNIYYTPKPHKLLMDGYVFQLNFEDDREAYEDYLELLGRQGKRTSNCNLNVYESEYNNRNNEIQPGLEELSTKIESMSEEEITELKDKMDSGFYPQKSVEKYYKEVDRELKSRCKVKEPKENKKENDKLLIDEELSKSKTNIKKEKIQPDENESLEEETKEHSKNESSSSNAESINKVFEGLKDILHSLLKGDSANFDCIVEKLSYKQLGDLKSMIQSEQDFKESDKGIYIKKIDRLLYKEKEKEFIKKASLAKPRNYEDYLQLINEIEKEDYPDSIKNSILKPLLENLDKRGRQELDNIISHIPENISRQQYEQFSERIEQYKEIDNRPYRLYLNEKRDEVEKQEIESIVKGANAKSRRSLFDLYNKLKNRDFEVSNVSPYLEKIYDKIYKIDEEAIKMICPYPADITFDEGMQAYVKISEENFLPELKDNTLALIDKRLMKIKMDECEQLVKKLSKEMNPIIVEDSRIYFYDVRKMVKEDLEDTDSLIIKNALNTYAADRGKYEYPILICDASYFANGGVGFVLTPDHIFYNGIISLGVIDVKDIMNVYADNGFLSKGVYVNQKNVGKVKISNSLKSNKLKLFAKVLNEFVIYLKEKPESRNVSYLAKEKHEVKCCYRCGYVYKDGNVCPKCGGKFNE